MNQLATTKKAPHPPGSRRLTRSQVEFILALHSFARNPTLCPTVAARLAGYSERHARAAAHRLLHAPQYQHVRLIGHRYVDLLFAKVRHLTMIRQLEHTVRLRQAAGLKPYLPKLLAPMLTGGRQELERLEAETRNLLDTNRWRFSPWL